MSQLRDQVALITGGSTGVGLGIAKSLAMSGCNLALASRDLERLEKMASQIRDKFEVSVRPYQVDLRQSASCTSLAEAVARDFGRIDVLVNNAGLGKEVSLSECSDEDWHEVIETNLYGTFFLTRAVVPTMREQGKGHVINIASQAAKRGYPNAGPYCASKFAILGMAEAWEQELVQHNIKFHSLCPALIQVPEPILPEEMRQGVLQVSDVAEAVRFVLTRPDHVKIQDMGIWHR